MTVIEFKKYVDQYVKKLAKQNNVLNLQKYYSQTDLLLPEINKLQKDSIEQTFAQFILHAQNATLISNIVCFRKNYDFIKEITCNFSPQRFLNKFEFKNKDDREKSKGLIVEQLRYDKTNNPNGLKWATSKSKNKDTIAKRFANTLIDGALYLKDFQSKQEVIKDFHNNFSVPKNLIKYTKKKFKHGFSVALCCDFLKELSPFFDLPKPDIHLMETMAKYMNYEPNYYKKSDKRAFECINDFMNLLNEIKKYDSNMTAYKLDRQMFTKLLLPR